MFTIMERVIFGADGVTPILPIFSDIFTRLNYLKYNGSLSESDSEALPVVNDFYKSFNNLQSKNIDGFNAFQVLLARLLGYLENHPSDNKIVEHPGFQNQTL
jgi:hypothetical protein